MQLIGHADSVLTMEFDPTGQHIASGSKDKRILLWNVYEECNSYLMLEGHKSAVVDVHWSLDASALYSCSADKSVAVWDVEYGRRVKKFVGHTGCVNACSPLRRGPMLVASGSDDGSVRVWDARSKRCAQAMVGRFPVTAACFGPDNNTVFSGGVDNNIYCWDLRKGMAVWGLEGHTDTVTYLSLSPDDTHVLSNSMDSTVRSWDVRPFVAGQRGDRVFVGARHGAEHMLLGAAWSANGERVAAGSFNGETVVWAFETGHPQYILPGHKSSVNMVAFHPKEPILGTCSSDKTIMLGEISVV